MMESSSNSPDQYWLKPSLDAVMVTRLLPVLVDVFADALDATASLNSNISGRSASTGTYTVGSVISNCGMSAMMRLSACADIHRSRTYCAPINWLPKPLSAESIALRYALVAHHMPLAASSRSAPAKELTGTRGNRLSMARWSIALTSASGR